MAIDIPTPKELEEATKADCQKEIDKLTQDLLAYIKNGIAKRSKYLNYYLMNSNAAYAPEVVQLFSNKGWKLRLISNYEGSFIEISL